MTGVEINNEFDRQRRGSITVFYTNSQRNALFKKAFIQKIDSVYKRLDTQIAYDEIAGLISTNKPFTPILTSPRENAVALNTITDYFHLLAVLCETIDPYPITVSSVETVNNITTVTLTAKSASRTTEAWLLTNFMGYTTKVCYIKQVGNYKYQLYADAALLTPLSPPDPYTGGTVARLIYHYAKPYPSTEKIGYFGQPTMYYPKYEIANSAIKLFPDTIDNIWIDYIKKPSVEIDVANNSFDYLTLYTYTLMQGVIALAVQLFFDEIRLVQLGQAKAIEIATEER